ncbi:hypothetical protein DL351_14885 [Pseudomonas aeruginosa]|nr:hypothetical protein D9D06_08370 [Pseudomonas aeruginosa]AYW40715.1 hypothetical protein DL351_14885 [Pseudomonas aeruginosa]
MCSDGAWLYGLSNPISTSNSQPNTPPSSGRSKVKRRGNSRKQVTDSTWALSRRRQWVSSSRLSRGNNSDRP